VTATLLRFGLLASPPPREEIRRVAENVFDRPEFERHKSLLQRILDWLADLLPQSSGSTTGGGGLSAAANLILYLTLAVMLVLLVWLVVRIVRARVRRPPAEDGPTITVEPARATADWRSEAEDHEAAGRWKQAMLCRYRELVGTLIDDGVLSTEPGRTTGELRAELRQTCPEAAADFDAATTLFELPWYADVDTGPEQYRRVRALAARIVRTAGAAERHTSEAATVGAGAP
jgi:hypothetical protein